MVATKRTATLVLVALLPLIAMSACTHAPTRATTGTRADTTAPPVVPDPPGMHRISNANGYIVEVLQAPDFIVIRQITDPYGRVMKFEYDGEIQPKVIHLFDWSQLEKADDGKWYHYSFPGWWPRNIACTIVRLSDGSVTVTTPSEIVEFSTSGVHWTDR